MPDQKQDPRDVDKYGWPRTIAGWIAPQRQPPIKVIKSPAEGEVAKIQMLKRDR